MSQCQETAGFLFSHACKEAGVHRCSACQKTACQKHAHMIGGAIKCTSCARKQTGMTKGARQQRRQGDEDLYDSPFFYGYYHYHGFGYYRHGYWGSDYLGDANDFSPADAEGLGGDPGSSFEHDPGGS